MTVTGTVELESGFTCDAHITVDASQDVTISGAYTITLGALFAGSTATDAGGSLFVNEGTLELDGITFATEATDGNRAVWNGGTLSVVGCTFELFPSGGGEFLARGGVIYSDSDGEIAISASTFKSNIASERGGAVYAIGSETLTITDSLFTVNEVGTGVEEGGAGGDVYAGINVELTVTGTTFSTSAAEYGGAAIECCGAVISNCTFTGADAASDGAHYGGALLVNRPDQDACSRELDLSDTIFSGCSVVSTTGAGGSVAIFDTSATITDCTFESSVGTAVLFSSSSDSGEHQLLMDYVQFNLNTLPAEAYATDTEQGAAIVVTNTGVEEGNTTVVMGEFNDMYCFGNDPYECEFVYDQSDIVHSGEFNCQLCVIDGVRQEVSGTDDDSVEGIGQTSSSTSVQEGSGTDDDLNTGKIDQSSSSGSWESKDYVIIGLSAAVACASSWQPVFL
ncbi:polymorphic outer membrane protein [Ectocarpus siliculosus]|uniref:Polymorphic outer membrane protein n=1 Tax=Ectocarpus siliculosus TaxID=2880 RepID=D7FVA0_ECTSI|nr:polymorphic outer membrane protein [Ectocarpus siliculosus]|eukprot:CBJ26272.1 polymorphic outer membrane protein [Ectocarpus siliculosus]